MIKLNGTLLAREIQKRKISNTDRIQQKAKARLYAKLQPPDGLRKLGWGTPSNCSGSHVP